MTDQPWIEPKEMIVLWNTGDDHRIKELIVIPTDAQGPHTEYLHASAGACDGGWLEDCTILSEPLGLYAFIATMYGFASKDVAADVLREFRKVKGMEWPAEMLNAMGVSE